MKILRELLILEIIFMCQPCLSVAQSKPVEVFVGGKRFDSFDSYKLERFKNELYNKMPKDSEKAVEEYMVQLREKFQKGYFSEYTQQQLDSVLKYLIKKRLEVVQNDSDSTNIDTQLSDMKKMMAELIEAKEQVSEVKINPNKVKTMVIHPKK